MGKYKKIVEHYESCFSKYGDNHKGLDWPNEEDVFKRFNVMLEIINFATVNKKVSLLDFGCGTAHLLEYINKNNIQNIEYNGLDISETFINTAKKKFPEKQFYCLDLYSDYEKLPMFDFIILNGVFTIKRDLTFEEMWEHFTKTITMLYEKANKGIAFNVMSKIVDWERDDLFHVSFDTMAQFLSGKLTRNFVFRNDYGLYEYTTYVLK